MKLTTEQIIHWSQAYDVELPLDTSEADIIQSEIRDHRQNFVVSAVQGELLNRQKITEEKPFKPSGILNNVGELVSFKLFEEVLHSHDYDLKKTARTSSALRQQYGYFRTTSIKERRNDFVLVIPKPDSKLFILPEVNHDYDNWQINIPVILDQYTEGKLNRVRGLGKVLLGIVGDFLDDWALSNPFPELED